jgi:hypothetical protein
MMKSTAKVAGLPKAFWLAQGFVAGTMLLLFLLFAGEDRLPRMPQRDAAKPVRPGAALATVRSTTVEETRTPAPIVVNPQAGIPYISEEYLSRVSRAEDYEQWILDPRELAWLLANRREVLVRDLETAPEPEGGLRVRSLRDACFGARRGLRVGDVLLNINGQELDSARDLQGFLEDPAYSSSRGWRLRLKRGDDVLTVDYR